MTGMIVNFAERLVSGQVETVKRRKPIVGDVIISASDRIYEVDEVLTDGYDRLYTVGVFALEDGLCNAFRQGEFRILSKAEAKAARAHYDDVRSNS